MNKNIGRAQNRLCTESGLSGCQVSFILGRGQTGLITVSLWRATFFSGMHYLAFSCPVHLHLLHRYKLQYFVESREVIARQRVVYCCAYVIEMIPQSVNVASEVAQHSLPPSVDQVPYAYLER